MFLLEDNFLKMSTKDEVKAGLIKKKIEKDFNNLNEEKIETFFDEFKNYGNGANMIFVEWYNQTVFNVKEIDFYEFDNRRHWATNLIRFDQKLLEYFQKNKKILIAEIKTRKNIVDFYKKYCNRDTGLRIAKRNEVAFCSKLFHSILPNEYPPADSHVRDAFRLPININSILILKKAYEDYIKDNKSKINSIRKILSKEKFSDFRVSYLSGMRILDMFYWWKHKQDNKQ